MKIEELMPQIRAGKKVRIKAWPEGDYMQYVEDAEDVGNYESEGNYTGFIAMVDGDGWQVSLGGLSMLEGDWELYDEHTCSP